MPTRAGVMRDILFFTTQLANLRAWLNASGWEGWSVADQSFAERLVGATWIRNGQNALCLVRVYEGMYQALVALNPPPALFDVLANVDPYAAISDLDDAATVLARRSAFHAVANNDAAIAKVRQLFPRQQPLYDEDGNQIGLRAAGVKFADFGDSFPDVAGSRE